MKVPANPSFYFSQTQIQKLRAFGLLMIPPLTKNMLHVAAFCEAGNKVKTKQTGKQEFAGPIQSEQWNITLLQIGSTLRLCIAHLAVDFALPNQTRIKEIDESNVRSRLQLQQK